MTPGTAGTYLVSAGINCQNSAITGPYKFSLMANIAGTPYAMAQQDSFFTYAPSASVDAIVTLGAADYMYALMSLGGSDGVTLTMNAVPQTYLAMAFLNGY